MAYSCDDPCSCLEHMKSGRYDEVERIVELVIFQWLRIHEITVLMDVTKRGMYRNAARLGNKVCIKLARFPYPPRQHTAD